MSFLLVLLVAASRFLPHPPNFACVGALGLFAGCYLAGMRAWWMPAAALLVSDVVGHALQIPGMGFYEPVTMACVYAGVMLAVPVGRYLREHRHWASISAGSLLASTLFFLLSNLGIWLAGWYPMSAGGLLTCYVNAVPFFGYTIAGDLFFTAVLFGAWEWSSLRRSALAGTSCAAA